ncbi:MAG: flagellar filament capping protein FliD [Oscillospiraceae bacterium]
MNSMSAYQTARKGMNGLMSGLDTEGIVKGMTSGTTTRIAKLLQDKQKITWRTSAYQGISGAMNDFSNKYLSLASSTSVYSAKFFQGSTAKVNGDFGKYVSVTGSSSTAGKFSIVGVNKTSTTSSMVSDKTVSSNEINTGKIDFSADGKVTNNLTNTSLNVTYGGKILEVKLKDFKFTQGATDEEKSRQLAAAVNAAMAVVDIGEGKNLGDKFEMTITADNKFNLAAKPTLPGEAETGDMTIIGASKALIDSLGFKAGATVKKDTPIVGDVIDPKKFETKLNFGDTLKGKSMSFNLNGVTRNIVFDDSMRYDNAANFAQDMNKKLSATFGVDRVQVKANADDTLTFAAYKKQGDGTMIIDPTSTLKMAADGENIMGKEGVFSLENYASSRISLSTAIGELPDSPFVLDKDGKGSMMINGVKIDYSKTDSITAIVNRVNRSSAGVDIKFMEATDKFSVTAKAPGGAGQVNITDVTGNFASSIFGTAKATQGQDAEIVVSYDGGKTTQVLQRESNTFQIDGMAITIAQDADKANISATNQVTFTSAANTDDIVKGIKAMVDDYNKLTEMVNKELTTKPNRNYQPLTDEQRKDMTEDQIKDWEKQAQAGLLFGDSTMRELSTELRFAFSFDVTNAATLKEMGIETSSAYSENGKIIIDEAKLKSAIENDLEGVKNAFTNPVADPKNPQKNEAGFMENVKKVVDKYAKVDGSYENKGLLIQMAGPKNSIATYDTTMSKQQKSIDEQLARLKSTLKSQEDRYYSEFTRLETYISQMEAQSSWLAQNA